MPNPSDTTARKKKFVANVQRLMGDRRLSVPETARRAGIEDRKRFYRWANSGIARAARDHLADLDGLRRVFGLSTIEDLWGDPPETSVEDQLIVGISAKPEYGYAAKLLFVLTKLPATEAESLRRRIDDAFDLETRHELPQRLMPALTGKQVMDRVRQRNEKAYASLVEHYGGVEFEQMPNLAALLTEDGISDPIAYMIDWGKPDTHP